MYKTFIPAVILHPVEIPDIIFTKKGMGLTYDHIEDVEISNCTSFYDWNSTKKYISDQRYIPMLWSGKVSNNIPKNYNKDILFLNEPNVESQSNITPKLAFELYLKAKSHYSLANIIPGGMGSLGEYQLWTRWFEDFLELFYKNNIEMPVKFHTHGYSETFSDNPQYNMSPENVITLWKRQLFLIGDSKLYVTEFGDSNANLANFKKLCDYCMQEKRIERIFPFVNRLVGNESWFPNDWNVNMAMVNKEGNLTEIGKYYKSI